MEGARKYKMSQHLRFQCEKCNKSFGKEEEFKLHRAVHSADFKCMECLLIFIDKVDCDNHMKTHASVPGEIPSLLQFQCQKCDKSFSKKEELELHWNVHIANKFKCEKCSLTFPTRVERDDHVKTHSRILGRCGRCGKNFVRRQACVEHVKHSRCNTTQLRKFRRENPYLCQMEPRCGGSFATEEELAKHHQSHHAVIELSDDSSDSDVEVREGFRCKECGKRFDANLAMAQHIIAVHGVIDLTPDGENPETTTTTKTVVVPEVEEEALGMGEEGVAVSTPNVSKGGDALIDFVNGETFADIIDVNNMKESAVKNIARKNKQKSPTNSKQLSKCLICGDVRDEFKSNLVDKYKPLIMEMRYICPECDDTFESADNLGDYFKTFNNVLELVGDR